MSAQDARGPEDGTIIPIPADTSAALPLGADSLNREAMIGRTVLVLALVLAASAAQAGLTSHSVSYEVKLAADEKAAQVEGQGSYSLTRSCQAWTVGEVYQFGIEKGGALGKLGPQADRLEERLTATEPLDGSQLSYQARLRLNARNTSAT